MSETFKRLAPLGITIWLVYAQKPEGDKTLTQMDALLISAASLWAFR